MPLGDLLRCYELQEERIENDAHFVNHLTNRIIELYDETEKLKKIKYIVNVEKKGE